MEVDTQQKVHAAPRRSAHGSSIEEIDRGSIRVIPEGSVEIQPPAVVVNSAPWRAIWGFGLLAIVDLAMNGAAGAAAASIGSNLNGMPTSTLTIQMGALAGVTKAAVTTFKEIVSMTGVNIVFSLLLTLITSSFGICPLLVTEVGNIVLGQTPRELVIAAIVAAIPLVFEMVRDIQPKSDDEGNKTTYRWIFAIFLIATDALGGYVFARMAANQGMPISNYHAACSAGAVFGVLTFLSRAMTGCVAMVERATDGGKVSDIFGVWEAVLPDKIVVTEEEYLQMQRELVGMFGGVFSSWPGMMRRYIKFFSCCCCCCFAWMGIKDVIEDMDEHFADMEAQMEYNESALELRQQMLPALRGS